jgi:hypothetical protein
MQSHPEGMAAISRRNATIPPEDEMDEQRPWKVSKRRLRTLQVRVGYAALITGGVVREGGLNPRLLALIPSGFCFCEARELMK